METTETAEPSPVAEVRCPQCRVTSMQPALEKGSYLCGVCRAEVQVAVFPRLTTSEMAASGAAASLPSGDEAVCRFFPELKAEKVCDECGSFLSEKAAVSWNQATYCMPCLHALRNRKGSDEFAAKTLLYDNLALSLVTWGFPLGLFTAPVALYFLIRYRKASRGLVPRSRVNWWIALLLACAILIFWAVVVTFWVGSLLAVI